MTDTPGRNGTYIADQGWMFLTEQDRPEQFLQTSQFRAGRPAAMGLMTGADDEPPDGACEAGSRAVVEHHVPDGGEVIERGALVSILARTAHQDRHHAAQDRGDEQQAEEGCGGHQQGERGDGHDRRERGHARQVTSRAPGGATRLVGTGAWARWRAIGRG